MTITDYAWAAGFMDGESCISLRLQGRYSSVTFVIVQKDRRPLDYFCQVFGISKGFSLVYRRDRKHVYHRLTVCGRQATDILRCVLPYLVLKREQAEMALELQATVDKYSCKERSAGLSDDEMAYRISLVARVKWLNSGRWIAAETKPEGRESVCDSPNCTDDKRTESAEMPDRVQ